VSSFMLDPSVIRDLAPEALGPDGRLRVLPAAFWADTTPAERALFGHRHGLYGFPTTELVEHLRELIADRPAIEIGAGHGVLAEALGIPATDNRMQEQARYRAVYAATRQPPVPYGPNVIECHASRAVRRFKPAVVVGCWVTHKYDPRRPEAGGNEVGIDESDVLANCVLYVVVGNEKVHEHKAIWKRKHTITYPGFVYSRAMNGSRDFIATWRGGRAERGSER
jgi:hypothetical protein